MIKKTILVLLLGIQILIVSGYLRVEGNNSSLSNSKKMNTYEIARLSSEAEPGLEKSKNIEVTNAPRVVEDEKYIRTDNKLMAGEEDTRPMPLNNNEINKDC